MKHSIVVALLLLVGCGSNERASEDESTADALTAGQADPTFGPGGRVELDEKVIGTRGTKIFFLGRDAAGTYIARRTSKLGIDNTYGTSGKVYVGGPITPRGATGDYIAAAAVLGDGRVVVTGSRDGVEGRVLDGVRAQETKLLVGVVSANGDVKNIRVETSVPLLDHCDGPLDRAVPAAAGTAVMPLADGGIAIGASASCYASNNTAARIYRFTLAGAVDLTFDKLFYQSGRGQIFGTTQSYGPAAISTLTEAKGGDVLLGKSLAGLMSPGDRRTDLSRAYFFAQTSEPNPTALQLTPIRSFGAFDQYFASAAQGLPDGSFLAAGYDDAKRCIALERTSTTPATDLVWSAPALPRKCIGAASVSSRLISMNVDGPGRVFIVSYVFAGGANLTRVFGVDEDGAPLAGFGNGGVVDVANEPNPRSAFIAGNYLYVQFADDSGKANHVRRIKL